MSNQDKGPGQNVEFLFLASHGLLSPISAIRWGSNRLKKTDTKKLSKEQRDLVDHIHSNARVLTKLFGSMMLLARNEDHTYELRSEPAAVKPLLQAEAKTWEKHTGGTVKISCPDLLKCQTDGALLEAVLQNMFMVFSEAGKGAKKISIAVTPDDGFVQISFSGSLEIPFLESVRTIDNLDETKPIIGGTSGLLLSLSHGLIGFLEGTLEMRETDDDEYVITARVPSL
jgi:K+-sensing histidine kinase KdpD